METQIVGRVDIASINKLNYFWFGKNWKISEQTEGLLPSNES
jgi:hypothetical protein